MTEVRPGGRQWALTFVVGTIGLAMFLAVGNG